MTENDKNEMLRVILCKPGETAEAVEIDDDLESMQELVGGLIQEFMPFHSETDPRYDDVAIICNEEEMNVFMAEAVKHKMDCILH